VGLWAPAFCVCATKVKQKSWQNGIQWSSTKEFLGTCIKVWRPTLINVWTTVDSCWLSDLSLSLGKLQSIRSSHGRQRHYQTRLGSRLLSPFFIWRAPTNWELISFKDDGSDYPHVHAQIYLQILGSIFVPSSKTQIMVKVGVVFDKAKASSFRYRDRLLLIPGEFITTNDSPDSRCCSWAPLTWLPSHWEDCQLGELSALSPQTDFPSSFPTILLDIILTTDWSPFTVAPCLGVCLGVRFLLIHMIRIRCLSI